MMHRGRVGHDRALVMMQRTGEPIVVAQRLGVCTTTMMGMSVVMYRMGGATMTT